MSDKERLDWLEKTSRLQDVYWRIENEGGSVRDAIDWLAKAQRQEEPLFDSEGLKE